MRKSGLARTSVPVGTRYRWGLGTGGDSVPVGTARTTRLCQDYKTLPGLQDFARTTRVCQDYKSLPGLQEFARTTRLCQDYKTLPGLQEFARTTRLCRDYKTLPGLQDFARTTRVCRDVAHQLWNSCGGHGGKIRENSKVAEREVQISYAFACVFATFAASPAPIMEPTRGAAEGRLHYGCWGGGKRSKNISKCI